MSEEIVIEGIGAVLLLGAFYLIVMGLGSIMSGLILSEFERSDSFFFPGQRSHEKGWTYLCRLGLVINLGWLVTLGLFLLAMCAAAAEYMKGKNVWTWLTTKREDL